MDTSNIENVYENEWGTFAEAIVFYKNRLYVFGGDDS